MASLECETPIDSLPEEILCMIFDHLDLTNVKNASLTCRRWHDIIFLSPYAERFQLIIFFDVIDSENVAVRMKKAIEVVQRTNRRYRHLLLLPCIDDDFRFLWECLHPKVTENICSLVLLSDFYSNWTIAAIFDGINLMPKLRSLIIGMDNKPDNLPVLKSSTVEHLLMEATDHIAIDMPQLQSYEGEVAALVHPDQSPVYAKLKRVRLTDNAEKLKDENFRHRWGRVQMPELQSYQGPVSALTQQMSAKRVTLTDHGFEVLSKFTPPRLANVETLQIAFRDIDDEIFSSICDMFSALKQLYFAEKLYDIDFLKQLSRFVNLRQLVFKRVIINQAPDFVIDLSQLTQLELLNLGSVELEAPILKHLSKSIRCLTVHIDSKNNETVMETITNSMPQLQKLRLNYLNYGRYEVTKHTLMSLPHLKQLEVLVFDDATFGESSFLDMGSPMHQMRELLFVKCNVPNIQCESDRNHLRECRKMFPNLEKIEFPSCLPPFYFSKEFNFRSSIIGCSE